MQILMLCLKISGPGLSPVYMLSRVQLFATPQTIAHQATLSIGFPRQEYWSGLPFPPPGDFPDPWIKPVSLASPALQTDFFTIRATWEGTPSTMRLYLSFLGMMHVESISWITTNSGGRAWCHPHIDHGHEAEVYREKV